MVILGRGTARLLKTVAGRPHASKDDHEEESKSNVSSPLSEVPQDPDEEDIDRDPDSSSEEEPPPSQDTLKDQSGVSGGIKRETTRPFNIHASKPTLNDQARKQSTDRSFVKAGVKRKEPDDTSIDEPSWFSLSSSQTRKAPKKYGSQPQRPPKETFKKVKQSPKKASKPSKAIFKRPGGALSSPNSSNSQPKPSPTSFVRPGSNATSPTRALTDAELDAILDDAANLTSPKPIASSPPLSPILSDADIEEIYLGVPNPSDYTPCPICSVAVPKTFREDWEVEHCRGRRMNLRLQEKFCHAHQERDARAVWTARKYPVVDWEDLPRRLRRSRGRIEEVLDGKRSSVFRKDWEGRVRDGESRTVMKNWKAGREDGTRVGYYGSRGAKVMGEFALQAFAGKFRRLAARDKLVAASGVAGGLSGFVQAVVVPELALALIMEDLAIAEGEARRVLDESSDLGDLLNTEEDEQLPVRAETPPNDDDMDGETNHPKLDDEDVGTV